jgi:hypothetical protein
MYLLDTNVVSELRKGRTRRVHPAVQRWADSVDDRTLYLSAITVLELEIGILQLLRKDATAGAVLRGWLRQFVLPSFADRILPIDADTALRCASLHIPEYRPHYDALIAATALVHNMTVVTRNTADFAPTGVATLNPWEA